MRVIGLAGWSGAGKTTVMVRLIPALQRRGVTVSTLKHAHHSFEIDKPGKDSYEHRFAGAQQVLVASAARWALVTELRDAPEPTLHQLLAQFAPVDLVVIEGYKREAVPKIEIHREANGKPWLCLEDPLIRAAASDSAPPNGLPWVSVDDVEAIAELVLQHATDVTRI